jgi:hypothetical protein
MALDDLLTASRVGVRRLDPHETVAAAARGALVVDTRTDAQRRRQGELPRDLLPRATDLAGGVEAWLDAGLPTDDGPADIRE